MGSYSWGVCSIIAFAVGIFSGSGLDKEGMSKVWFNYHLLSRFLIFFFSLRCGNLIGILLVIVMVGIIRCLVVDGRLLMGSWNLEI